MISLINGTVRSISSDRLIIEVGGVGLSVLVTAQCSTSLNLGTHVQLFTTLVVREDSLTLFGFLDDESRALFELVQTVSGIGPKVALSIIGALPPQELASAILSESASTIEKIPGIGKKGAQRLILELKSKMHGYATSGVMSTHQPAWREQLASALVSLGYSAKESDGAINLLVEERAGQDIASMEMGELLKLALQSGRRT